MISAIEDKESDSDSVIDDGADLIYYSDESVDITLQKLVDLLAIPAFSTDRLSVKRVVEGSRKRPHCFRFAPVEIPVRDRVAAECGPGSYEVWIANDKGGIHKRLKLNIGAGCMGGAPANNTVSEKKSGPEMSDNSELKREIDRLSEKISGLSGGQGSSDKGITHRDLIDAEERGYKRAKESFDLQIATIKESHALQVKMVEESKGIVTDSGIDDDSIIGQITSAIAAAKDAGGPIIDAYAYKMQGETDIRKARAGLYGEEFESEEGEPEEDGYEMTGDDVARLTNTMTELTNGAVSGGDAKKHAEKVLSEYEGGFAKWVFLSEGALDSYFAQRPDMIGKRPWFESVLDHMKSGIEKA
ncbi:MAG: hypothetical protein RPU34_13560, partial [Candidatus Sedimenticola sp. (ex Thyasira tokunagai)]